MREPDRTDASLAAARLELTGLARTGAAPALLQRALDIAEQLTGSKIGFFHFIEEDQESLTLQTWSTNTLRRMCTAEGQGRHYPITQAGVWVDCFRARRPIIHNDYPGLRYRKGLPPGHAAILRELTVPVIRGDKVLAIAGVGNKATDYTDEDVLVFERLATLVMELIQPPAAKTAPPRAG